LFEKAITRSQKYFGSLRNKDAREQ